MVTEATVGLKVPYHTGPAVTASKITFLFSAPPDSLQFCCGRFLTPRITPDPAPAPLYLYFGSIYNRRSILQGGETA